ncbi:hypothetical protein ABZU25_33875 [Micromonospora sp. NPDC005215]|uniref:hypothetical protein n=1 Tax=Micromonospora sp. NPDC005215 TaxID=3157024 RepID=UPI0033BE403D
MPIRPNRTRPAEPERPEWLPAGIDNTGSLPLEQNDAGRLRVNPDALAATMAAWDAMRCPHGWFTDECAVCDPPTPADDAARFPF